MESTGSLSARSDEKKLLAELGIRIPEQVSCGVSDAAEAAAAMPGEKVVVKVAEPYIAHKTEVGAVRIVGRSEVAATVNEMASRLSATGFTLSEYVEHDLGPGSELLLTIRWTPEFGPVVTFGAGGIATEVLSSVAVLAPGITVDVEAALASKNFTPLITGFRNQKAKIERGALRDLLMRAMDFASRHVPHDFAELEINPLVPSRNGLYAVDTLWREAGDATAREPRPVGKIARLLAPKSIAVMGVSRSLNPGRVIVNNLTKAEFAGRIYIVKPGEESVDGIPCVPDVTSLPETVDLLVLSIAAEQVPDTLDEVIASGRAESVIVIPGGLGEYSGSETLELRVKSALAASRSSASGGPIVNGANCLGIESQPARVNTVFLPEQKLKSGVETEVPLAIVSQSGALAVVLRTKLTPFVPRYIVSIGNQIDLTVADYLEYLSTERDLDVLAFYVEGFTPLDGQRWMKLAGEAVRSGRKVILYRAGRT
ncbi:MAG: acetate--CoA ligase family protein, partial [Thermoanaerobaculia bacterium]